MSIAEDAVLNSGEGGNNNPLLSKSRSKRFKFVWNNYGECDVAFLKSWDEVSYIHFAKEVAPTTGMKHLDGYFEMKKVVTLNVLWKKFPKTWIRVAKGNVDQNVDYSSKEEGESFVRGEPMKSHGGARRGAGRPRPEGAEEFRREVIERLLVDEYTNVLWSVWQAEALRIIEAERSDRLVHWFWEPEGNRGKSYLAKYVVMKEAGVIVCDGKKDNIFNQVNTMMEAGIEPRIVIMDIPRQMEGKINMGVIEALKNGMIYSGKYEGGVCCFRSPVVLCFANFKPEVEGLSMDRWNIRDIREFQRDDEVVVRGGWGGREVIRTEDLL